jgi:DNA polymerase-3 subunit delta'
MYFKNIVGHSSIKQRLIKNVKTGHIPHAIMLAGMDGGGNLPLALAFAGYLYCTDRGETDRCGKCTPCRQMDSLGYPDLHFSFPFIKSQKAKTAETLRREFVETLKKQPYLSLKDWETKIADENKKEIITADESAEIIKTLSLKSFAGGYKVMLIWRADRMNASAANRLLKTLEEPSDKTIIVLVTNPASEMLPTIVSRTQLYNCKRLSDSEIAEWLMDKTGAGETEALDAARLADGDFHLANSILTSEGEDTPFLKLLMDYMRSCVKSSLQSALEVCDALSKMGRDNQKRFIEYCLQFLHKSILYQYAGPDKARFDNKALEFAHKFSPYMMQGDLSGFHDIFSKGHYLIDRNVNAHLLFAKMGYDMMKLFRARNPEPIA